MTFGASAKNENYDSLPCRATTIVADDRATGHAVATLKSFHACMRMYRQQRN